MHRVIEPEWLDSLSPLDPGAIRSRADLRRLNALMGHARILTSAFAQTLDLDAARPRYLQFCELGAGDGHFFLQLARRCSRLGVRAEVELIDRLALVSEETRKAIAALDWCARPVVSEAMPWLAHSLERADVIFANLFLHHFQDDHLRKLFDRVAGKANLFIACEPRRSTFSLAAAHLVWLAGCNPVTRHDAVASVRAGFAGNELSALWGWKEGWRLSERPAGLFSHLFIAQRHG